MRQNSEPNPETASEPSSKNKSGAPESLVAGVFLGAIGLGLALLIAGNLGVEWTWKYWGVYGVNGDGTSATQYDRSAIFRNFSLVALAAIGLAFAIWRSWLAHRQTQTGLRQTDIAIGQAKNANKQAEIAEKGLFNDRFQKGAQMLESGEPTVRIAGIYALRHLTLEETRGGFLIVQDLLCDFVRERSKVREPLKSKVSESNPELDYGPFPPDLQRALETIFHLRNAAITRFKEMDGVWRPDLRQANLSGAELYQAGLSRAFLTNANLSGAKLGDADFIDANLEGADLSGAVLDQTELPKSNLQNVNLSKAELHGTDLSGADLTSVNMSGVEIYGADFSSTDLTGGNLSGAKLHEAKLSDADLTGADLSGTESLQANLSESNLENANLSGATLMRADLSGAILENANLSGSTLNSGNLSGAKLEGTNLFDAKIFELNVSGADFKAARLDDDTALISIWAYEDNPPENMPQRVSAAIAYRQSGEAWNDFVDRIIRERPELDWTESMKQDSPG